MQRFQAHRVMWEMGRAYQIIGYSIDKCNLCTDRTESEYTTR